MQTTESKIMRLEFFDQNRICKLSGFTDLDTEEIICTYPCIGTEISGELLLNGCHGESILTDYFDHKEPIQIIRN